MTTGAEVTFGEGVNSPVNDSPILISSPSEGIVLGQFYLFAEGNNDKSYNFNELMIKFKAESDIQANNFKLYKDINGDGKVDSGDTEIASSSELKNSYVNLAVTDPANRLTASGIKNYFIVTTDAKTTSDARPGKFSMIIEGGESFKISDSAKIEAKGQKIEFVEYRFEPNEGFIITKGDIDPKVPSYKDFNGEHEMLQVRTKSKGTDDAVSSITLKTPNSFVKFGEGIRSVSLILDKDGNGLHSAGDEVLATVKDFANPTTIQIDGLKDILKYEKDEEKFLLFKVEFKMSVGETAKIQVSSVKVKSGNPVVEVPVSSKEFKYECDKNDPNSCASDDDSGCAVTELPENTDSSIWLVLAALAMLALAAIKGFSFKK